MVNSKRLQILAGWVACIQPSKSNVLTTQDLQYWHVKHLWDARHVSGSNQKNNDLRWLYFFILPNCLRFVIWGLLGNEIYNFSWSKWDKYLSLPACKFQIYRSMSKHQSINKTSSTPLLQCFDKCRTNDGTIIYYLNS